MPPESCLDVAWGFLREDLGGITEEESASRKEAGGQKALLRWDMASLHPPTSVHLGMTGQPALCVQLAPCERDGSYFNFILCGLPIALPK